MILLPETRWTYRVWLSGPPWSRCLVATARTAPDRTQIVWTWGRAWIDLRSTLRGAMVHHIDILDWREGRWWAPDGFA